MRKPRATTLRRVAALAYTLVFLCGACGGGGPAPRVWAASVCEALAPWRAEINNLTRSTQQQMTAQTTPAQAKENLVRMLGGAEQASETARRAVAEAGVPDVDRGDVVSDEFVASLAAVRDAYGRARSGIERLGTGQATAFYDGVKAAVDTLNEEYAASAPDTGKLDSPELKKAFDEVPECR